MTRNRANTSLCLALVASVVALLGCRAETAHEKEYFVLEAKRQGAPAQGPIENSTLEVSRLSVDAAFATKNLIYRTGQYEYQSDYYRQFLISPGVMATEKTRDWLAEAGLFRQVLPVGSRLAADYTLEGTVTALYGDFRDPTNPAAILEIRFFLLMSVRGSEKVAFTDTYRAVTLVPGKTPEAFMAALNDSLVEILRRLEQGLVDWRAERRAESTPAAGS